MWSRLEEALAQGKIAVRGTRKSRAVRRSDIVLGNAALEARLSREELERQLQEMPNWSQALPGLVGTTQAGQAWLFDFLAHLAARGPATIRFGDLADVVEQRVRQSWAVGEASAAVPITGEDDLVDLIRIVEPDSRVEDQEHWRALVERIEEALRRQVEQQATRDRLLRTFRLIVRHIEEDSRKPIRQADLCRALGVPPATMHGDIAVIGQVVRHNLGR
jgi:hypothetical protein